MKKIECIAGAFAGLMLTVAVASIYSSVLTGIVPLWLGMSVFLVLFAAAAAGDRVSSRVSSMELGQVGMRVMFENAVELLRQLRDPFGAPYNVSGAKMTMSYIRGEVPLSTSLATYNVPIIENARVGAPRVNQQLVQLQDVFVANQIGFFIGIGAETAANTRLYTYGSQVGFPTANTATSLLSLYNGKMVLLNNNEQVVPAWDLSRHYKVPQIQAINDLYYDGTAVQQDQIDLGNDGFYPNEPGWVINGAGKMQLQVQAGAAPAAIETNSFLCVIMRGILFQNVTTVK